jgi:hypothetical protein
VGRENRWCNAPHVPGIAFEELGVRRTFEIEPKLLMNRKIAFVCLMASAAVGAVLLGVKDLNGGTELQPRAFTACRHPQQ